MSKKEQYIFFVISFFIMIIGGIFLFIYSERGPSKIMKVTPSSPSPSPYIIVHVAGAVKNPGVYKLKKGFRIYNAIDKAGGALEVADLDILNLAKILKDGEKVFVPKKRTITTSNTLSLKKDASDSYHIDINTADEKTLKLLPGVGSVLAKRIIEYRENHGPFSDISDLKKVSGIGEKKFIKIKEYLETH